MKKMILLALAALMLLSALTACRMPEKKDPFKEILEENPDMELPKSEVMEIDPEDAPKYEINDVVDGYEGTEVIPLPAVGDYAAGELVVKYRIYDYALEVRNVAVVSVENHSEQPLSISIKGKCENVARGDFKEITRSFEGFAPGWQNYFIFAPETSFNSFTYELEYELYEGKTFGHLYQNLHWSGLRLNNAALSPTEKGCVRVMGLFYYDYVGDNFENGFGGGYVLFNEFDEVLYCEMKGSTFKKVQEAYPDSYDGHSTIMPHLGKDEGFMWDDIEPKRNNLKIEDSNYVPTDEKFEVAYGIYAFNGMYECQDDAPPTPPPDSPISDIW